MVVIVIIVLLSGIVLFATKAAREKAKTVEAVAELDSARDGTALLYIDTRKFPFGCTSNKRVGWFNEVALNDNRSGIINRPDVGITDDSVDPACEWTAKDRANWNGPYMPAALDPWGNPYMYDSDYYPRGDCDLIYDINDGKTCWRDGSGTNNNDPLACRVLPIKAFVSEGPTKLNGGVFSGYYDCDDVYLPIP